MIRLLSGLLLLATTAALLVAQEVGKSRSSTSHDMTEAIRERAARGETVKCGSAFRFAWLADRLGGRTSVSMVLGDRPVLHTSRPSPSGRFRIHFDTTGTNAPALLTPAGVPIPGTAGAFVDSTGAIFDEVWHRIVNGYQFLPPPPDTAGGDAAYDVYLEALTPGLFGELVPEGLSLPGAPNERYVSHLVVDNDFAGLRTSGLDGLRITAAHEFFHAVQVGAYGIWDTREYYFYELSSVWMETVLFPSIEDYLLDVPDYFALFPGASFATYNMKFRGYERSVFALYLGQRFGQDAMRQAWDEVSRERVLPALDRMLRSRGSSLREAFREFSVWNYFTADRADTRRSYAQGARFPRMAPAVIASWSPPGISLSYGLEPLSHATLVVRTPTDTLSLLVVNADAASAGIVPLPRPMATAQLTDEEPAIPAQQISGGFWLATVVEEQGKWFSDAFSATGRGEVPPTVQRPWPSPWLLTKDIDLVLPVSVVDGALVRVDFVSSGAGVVSTGERAMEMQRGMRVVRVPVADVRHRLGSGVYVVVIRAGSDQETWKVAVVR